MQRGALRLFAAATIVIVAAAWQVVGRHDDGGSAVAVDEAPRIVQAFEAQRSDLWVESGGTVERQLSDDREGSADQRFIVRLANGHTVLIAHNNDLAPRVPLQTGDRVTFRGEYEWNPKGGVIHWTHHDPRGRHDGGWIQHRGDIYQ